MSPIIVSSIPWEDREKIKSAVYTLTVGRGRDPSEVEYNYIAVMVGHELNEAERKLAEGYWLKMVNRPVNFLEKIADE